MKHDFLALGYHNKLHRMLRKQHLTMKLTFVLVTTFIDKK